MRIVDEKGIWEKNGKVKILIEPTKEYLDKRKLDNTENEERKLQIAKLKQVKNIQEKTIDLLIHIIQENNLSVSTVYQEKINKYKELLK